MIPVVSQMHWLSWNGILDQNCDSSWQKLPPISLVRNPIKVHLPGSCQSHPTAVGRDLPDADGPGYVSLNSGFREGNRSLIGHKCRHWGY
jgi:hypothetical protein